MMIAYPISISADGGLSISRDPEVDNVRALIDTRFYERYLFPNYGLGLDLFDALSTFDIDLAILQLNLQLTLWHSFVTQVSVDTEYLDAGVLGLNLSVSGREVREELTNA